MIDDELRKELSLFSDPWYKTAGQSAVESRSDIDEICFWMNKLFNAKTEDDASGAKFSIEFKIFKNYRMSVFTIPWSHTIKVYMRNWRMASEPSLYHFIDLGFGCINSYVYDDFSADRIVRPDRGIIYYIRGQICEAHRHFVEVVKHSKSSRVRKEYFDFILEMPEITRLNYKNFVLNLYNSEKDSDVKEYMLKSMEESGYYPD